LIKAGFLFAGAFFFIRKVAGVLPSFFSFGTYCSFSHISRAGLSFGLTAAQCNLSLFSCWCAMFALRCWVFLFRFVFLGLFFGVSSDYISLRAGSLYSNFLCFVSRRSGLSNLSLYVFAKLHLVLTRIRFCLSGGPPIWCSLGSYLRSILRIPFLATMVG